MLNRTTAFRLALIALLMAALACNAVTRALGGNAADAAEATASALQTEAAAQFGDTQATADALSTEAAEVFDDLETPEAEDPGDDDPVDEEEPSDEPSDEPGDIPGSSGAPDDIPVFDGNNTNFFGSDDVVSYTTDGSYDDVVAFYRAEMEANGWTYNSTMSTEFGGIAALTYEKDGRTATVSIVSDPASGGLLVAITIL